MWLSSETTDIRQNSLLALPLVLADTRAIWLRTKGPVRGAALRLMENTRFAGFTLDVVTYEQIAVIPFWRYDFVLLEYMPGQEIGVLTGAIKRVRQLSSVPLVVLAKRMTLELTLAGLHAGADSVSPLYLSNRILLAHWGAMLRRWKTKPY